MKSVGFRVQDVAIRVVGLGFQAESAGFRVRIKG